MGKKKAFIDKKKAVTYSLVYREPLDDVDADAADERVLAPVGGHRGAAQQESNDYDDYEESLYESEYSLAMSRGAASHHDASYTLSEERRRELLSLGFPDDGYDYLKHLRDLGRGRPAPGRGTVETILEDQELDGFEEEELEGDLLDEGPEEDKEEDDEEDFTIYDMGPEEEAAGTGQAAAAAGGSVGEKGKGKGSAPAAGRGGRKGRLDAQALAAAAEAEAAAGAGPTTSSGAGPGPSSAAGPAAADVAGSARGGRSVAARSVAASAAAGFGAAGASRARSMASTARTHGSGVGPSVYVAAAKLVPPKPDVKVVDARRLVVKPKGQDEAAAAAVLSEVSAMARPTELRGHRGKLYQDLDEVEKSLAEMENGNNPNRAEVVEGDEWGDWLDEFVAGGGDDEGAAAAGGPAAGPGEEEEEEGGGESEEPEDDDEELDEWKHRHRRSRQAEGQAGPGLGQQEQQQEEEEARRGEAERPSAGRGAALDEAAGPAGPRTAGPGAASVASSYWQRPERRDRKQGFEALDSQFERLAVEYDDEEIGDLEDGRYDNDDEEEEEDGGDGSGPDHDDDDDGDGGRQRRAGDGGWGRGGQAAAGNCELSDFADVLDEFLQEHRAAEVLEAEGLKPLEATDDVALQASRPDPAALAATRARLRKQAEAQAAAGGNEDAVAEPKRTIVVQEAERWDCESILSLTSNLENHPGKIVEPQRRTGVRSGGLIRLSAKTGMPVVTPAGAGGPGAAPGAIPEEEEEEKEGGSGGSGDGSDGGGGGEGGLDPALLERRKGETAEERKARKAAVKEARRAQRTAKKEMKTMFKQQASRAQKQAAGRSQAAGSTYVIP